MQMQTCLAPKIGALAIYAADMNGIDSDIPEAQRTITAALCYAYDQGRIAEIVGDKR